MTYHAQACYKVRPIGCKLTPDPTMPSDQDHIPRPRGLFGARRWLSGAISLGALLVLLAAGGAAAQTKSQDVSRLNKQLFSAVRADQDARVRSQLTAGADPMAVNAFGLTPAGLAIERGNFKMAHYILAVRNQRVMAKERAAERRRARSGHVPETVAATAPAANQETPAAQPAAPIPARQAQTPPPAAAAAQPDAAPPPPGRAVAAIGGRNPFDPLAAASSDLPTLKITEATGAGQSLQPANENAAAPKSEPSEPGLLGRMVGGITGVFSSEQEAPAPAPATPPATKNIPAAKNTPADGPQIQMRRLPKAAPAAQAAPGPEPVQTARAPEPGKGGADEPGIFGRITGGITGVFSSDPEPNKNKIDSEAAPSASAKQQPAGDTESGLFGRMMDGIANVAGAGGKATTAPEKTAAAAPQETGGDTTVISSFFKTMFNSGETETPGGKPETKAEPKPEPKIERKIEPKSEPEAVVGSAADAKTPATAPNTGLNLPAVQVADATPPKVEASPPETKATLPESKAAPPKTKAATVQAKAAPAEPKPAPPSPAPFSAAGGATGPLPTISDPNLTASAKTAAPAKPATLPAAAEDGRSGLDKFLRRMFTEPKFFDKRPPEEAPKEAPAPASEATQSASRDGPSVETIAAAPSAGNDSAGAETPETAPGKSVSSKLDGFFKGLAKGFSDKSRPEKTATTEIAEAPPAAEPAPVPAKRSKLDRFVRGLFKAKPKTAEADKTTEIAEVAAPPAPAPVAKAPAAPAANNAPQASTKFTELASRPPTSRRRLGQGGGRRRAEAIPFIPAVTLTVGETLTLGRTLSDAMSRAANCFQKGKNAGWYCLETADWPDEIRERLRVSTWIYRKAMTIVHYRSGRAQRIFSVFPAKNFNKVVRFLEAKFGPPAEETEQFIALIGAPPKLNLRVKWKRKNADGSISALEVRKFDNVRRMVPDTNIGFIRLYREGSRPIFRTINESDLMLQSLRNSRLR